MAAISLIYSILSNLSVVGNWTGTPMRAWNEEIFVGYEGIRYGKPPTKELRFKDPVPAAESANTEYVVNCLELDVMTGHLIGVEDCLFLNVYNPIGHVNKSFPVLVWIHGQPFLLGDNRADVFRVNKFMALDLVVVTMSYRLGLLGFASFEEETLPGNYGLKDQQLAINWVLNNIHRFGGDPERITLVGEGAGASYVLFHLNGAFSGIIKRGVVLSGSSYAPWALSTNHYVRNETNLLYKTTNCKNLDCLRSYKTDKLLWMSHRQQKRLKGWWRKIVRPYKPVVDGDVIRSGQQAEFSLLIGLKKDEGVAMTDIVTMFEDEGRIIKSFCRHTETLFRWAICPFNNQKVTADVYEPGMDGLRKYMADSWFYVPAMAEAYFHKGPVNAFMFQQNYGPSSCSLQYRVPFMHVRHRCPPFNRPYDILTMRIAKVINRFARRKELQLRPYSRFKSLFDVTKALHNPRLFTQFDQDLAKRLMRWRPLILQTGIQPDSWIL